MEKYRKKKKIWITAMVFALLLAMTAGTGVYLYTCEHYRAKTNDYPVMEETVRSILDFLWETKGLEEPEFPVITSSELTKDVEALFVSENIYCIYNGEEYFYIDQAGESLTGDTYTRAFPFHEGLACVYKNGKYGFIDREGSTVLPFEYDEASPFVEGLAYFCKDDSYGFMDRTGEPKFYLDCDSVSTYAEGLAYICADGKYGYIDDSGKTVIEPVYDDAECFQGGLAEVVKDGKRGVIDSTGRQIIPPEYVEIERGKFCIRAERDEKYEVFDLRGNALLDEPCDWVFLSQTEVDEIRYEEQKKSGFIYQGEVYLFEGIYNFVKVIPEHNLVIAKSEESYGVMDFKGDIKIPFSQKYISHQDEEDVFLVSGKNQRCSIINADDFTQRMEGEYDFISSFLEAQAVVSKNDKYGTIDMDGNLVMPLSYKKIRSFDNGSYWYQQGTESYLFDKSGILLNKGNYSDIDFAGSCYKVRNENFDIGFLNARGSEILAPEYFDYNSNKYGDYGVKLLRYPDYSDGYVIVKIGESEEEELSKMLFCNQITPRAKKFYEFLQDGSFSVNDMQGSHEVCFAECKGEKILCKFYDFSHTARPVLYVYVSPYINCNFPKSHSGFFAQQGEEIVCRLSGFECGGSARGDRVCLWYDREEENILYGTTGILGGIGGSYSYDYVYDDTGDAWSKRVDFEVTATQSETKYSINGEDVTTERYGEVGERYQLVEVPQ